LKPNEAGEGIIKQMVPGGDKVVDAVKDLDPTDGEATDFANDMLDPIQKAVGQDKVDGAIADITDSIGLTL